MLMKTEMTTVQFGDENVLSISITTKINHIKKSQINHKGLSITIPTG